MSKCSDLCLVQLCYLQRTGKEMECEECLVYQKGEVCDQRKEVEEKRGIPHECQYASTLSIL